MIHTYADVKKLDTTQSLCMCRTDRSGGRDKTIYEDVSKTCNPPSIQNLVTCYGVRWLGIICRMEDKRLPKDPIWEICMTTPFRPATMRPSTKNTDRGCGRGPTLFIQLTWDTGYICQVYLVEGCEGMEKEFSEGDGATHLGFGLGLVSIISHVMCRPPWKRRCGAWRRG